MSDRVEDEQRSIFKPCPRTSASHNVHKQKCWSQVRFGRSKTTNVSWLRWLFPEDLEIGFHLKWKAPCGPWFEEKLFWRYWGKKQFHSKTLFFIAKQEVTKAGHQLTKPDAAVARRKHLSLQYSPQPWVKGLEKQGESDKTLIVLKKQEELLRTCFFLQGLKYLNPHVAPISKSSAARPRSRRCQRHQIF